MNGHDELTFTLDFIPVPYTRMTRRGKFVVPKARRYLDSQRAMGLILRNQMHVKGYTTIQRGTPLWVSMNFVSIGKPDHRKDLSNLLKAVEDAMNNVVWDDDRWVDVIDAVRTQGDGNRTVITVRRL